jgi:hypothetical protein
VPLTPSFRFVAPFPLTVCHAAGCAVLTSCGVVWLLQVQVRASKVLKFAELPRLLVLHLKRFEFNRRGGFSCKLSDRVGFGLRLHFDHYRVDTDATVQRSAVLFSCRSIA